MNLKYVEACFRAKRKIILLILIQVSDLAFYV